MKIKFLGATTTVTGSKYFLMGKNHNLLIDCGFFQGTNSEEYNLKTYQLLKDLKIDAIVLTHAHLDHSGYLPKLVKEGFKGKIFSTLATKELTRIILEDNASIQMNELKKNKINKKPLYEKIHVNQTMALFETKKFDEFFEYHEFQIVFRFAGHILGASSPVIKCDKQKIQFSGDLGRFDDLTMYPPSLAEKDCDFLVLESTYGDRVHLKKDFLEELAIIIKKNKEKKATLLIPAFSVGRSQTLMFALFKLFEKFPELEQPVYIDSPMTQMVTKTYHNFFSEHKISENLLKAIEQKFHFVQYQKEKERLDHPGNKIILTASGMMSGGNILHHLEIHGIDSNNTILIVGFQSPETIGRQLINDQRNINIDHKNIFITAQIENITLFSSHADQEQILNWCKESSFSAIFLVHGEENSKKELQVLLQNKLNAKVQIAKPNEFVNFDSL